MQNGEWKNFLHDLLPTFDINLLLYKKHLWILAMMMMHLRLLTLDNLTGLNTKIGSLKVLTVNFCSCFCSIISFANSMKKYCCQYSYLYGWIMIDIFVDWLKYLKHVINHNYEFTFKSFHFSIYFRDLKIVDL